jgi:preprotein translocase subunit SecA
MSQAKRIIRRSDDMTGLSAADLTHLAKELRWRARSGTPLRQLLPEAYALVRTAAARTLHQSHYPVQIVGGIALFEGGLAEMQTGEGKTLTATLPAFLRALPGRGCHVITVNDYLAQRDAETLQPLYELLGLTVGCIIDPSTPVERKAAYRCDITYTTGREVGFDFLRDRLQDAAAPNDDRDFVPVFESGAAETSGVVQRGLHFALVDEADSVLIDDAGTPLVIGMEEPQTEAAQQLFAWSRQAALQLKPVEEFVWRQDQRQAELTEAGCWKTLLIAKPPALDSFDAEKLYHHVEQALRAELGFENNRDYVVKDGEVAIVDESTGRILDGRKWQEGLHQAVEAKEGVEITADTGEAARITVQSFFRRYQHLAGMTGTAVAAAREFRRTYRLGVTAIPTHRPTRRRQLPPRIFLTQDQKNDALAAEIHRLHCEGNAILVGTPSVRASGALSRILHRLETPHCVLNAFFHAEEAQIVAQAGQPGQVTIATNMAGRGTDILLHDDVRARGGLWVFATEMHPSRRIDRQLIGRCARQGDPGSYQFWLSLHDELFDHLSPAERSAWIQQPSPDQSGELPRHWLRLFRCVQRRLENRMWRERQQLQRQELERERVWHAMGLDPFLELTE